MAAEYRSRSGSVCKGNYVGNETYREMYMEFLDLKLPYSTTLSLMEAMSTSWGSTPNGGINSDERVCDFFEVCFALMLYGNCREPLFQLCS